MQVDVTASAAFWMRVATVCDTFRGAPCTWMVVVCAAAERLMHRANIMEVKFFFIYIIIVV